MARALKELNELQPKHSHLMHTPLKGMALEAGCENNPTDTTNTIYARGSRKMKIPAMPHLWFMLALCKAALGKRCAISHLLSLRPVNYTVVMPQLVIEEYTVNN